MSGIDFNPDLAAQYALVNVAADTGRVTVAGKEIGDTGWREISSLLINGWALGAGVTALYLRRVGYTVEVYANNAGDLDSTSKSNDVAVAAISGFSASSTVRRRVGGDAFWSNGAELIASGVSGSILAAGTWTTTDEWPSTLPGSAAV